MSLGREIKRRVKAIIPSVCLLAIAGYFGWSATQGDHGLQAYARQQDQLRFAQIDLDRAGVELQAWERRVGALRPARLDPDMLDERARAVLNVADPGDIVMFYGQGRKLF